MILTNLKNKIQLTLTFSLKCNLLIIYIKGGVDCHYILPHVYYCSIIKNNSFSILLRDSN